MLFYLPKESKHWTLSSSWLAIKSDMYWVYQTYNDGM